MRKRSGAIIFSAIVITVIVMFCLFPVVREFIDAIAALVTLIGVLIAIFTVLHPSENEEEISEKATIEEGVREEVDTEEEIHISSPISGLCLGRDTELSKLEEDLTHKNVLLIKGIPGIGKTTLGLKFRDILEKKGYHTLWYQCDSESYEGFLLYLSDYLKNRGSLTFESLREQGIPPQERLKTAVQELCSYPTVLFLDNFQVVNDSDFRIFKDHLKNSTLVVMSRTQPAFLMESYESLPYLDRDSSLDLLRTLEVKESPGLLEKIYEKTQGHPWSLMQFADLARVLPVKELIDELPDFGKEQERYLNEECWRHLNENERDLLMRASVFTKPLTFDALGACSKEGTPSDVALSLAQRFYLIKREEHYYIHDIMKDFSFSKLKEDSRLYIEAQRIAADYYRRKISAENLLLMYYHLKEAGNHKEGIDSILENIDYFWKEGYWSDARRVLVESLNFFKDEKTRADIYFSLGTIVDKLCEWDRAIDYYEKSLEISEEIGDIHGIGRTYCALGLVYARKGEWDKAIGYYEKSLEISEKLGDIHGMALAYGNLGLVYADKGEWDKAIEYYEKSLEIFEKLGDIHRMALAYGNLGLVYADKGEWDKAIEYHEKSLETKEKLGDVHGMAQTYNNLGIVYADKGEWDKAIGYYEKSLEIFEKLGDVHGMAQTYNNLGSVHARKGEWDKAIEYFEKNLEIFEKLGDTHGMAQIYGNLGLVYARKGEWDKAIEYFEKSLEIFEKLGDVHGMAQTYGNLGLVYADTGEWDKAIEYYEKSLEIFEKLRDVHGMAQTCGNLGSVYTRKGECDKAIEYHEKSLEIFKKLGDIHGMAQTYNNLGSAYYGKGQWNSAIGYYEKSLEIKEKLGDIQGVATTKYGIANILRQRKEFDKALNLYFESELTLKKLGDKYNLMKVYYYLFLSYKDMNQKDEAYEYYQKYEELRKQLGI